MAGQWTRRGTRSAEGGSVHGALYRAASGRSGIGRIQAQLHTSEYVYVYVFYGIESKRFYIGYTNDLKRRFLEHKNKKVRATSRRKDLKLIFYEAYISRGDAVRREKYFKTTKGKRALKLMLFCTLNNLDKQK